MSKSTIFQTEEIMTGTQLIAEGDVALILKKDGTVRALTFGYDRSRLLQPESALNDEDRAMLEQGKKLFALAFAAGHPRLLQTLIDIAADPAVVDPATLTAATVCH
jgi:hypothetical protein